MRPTHQSSGVGGLVVRSGRIYPATDPRSWVASGGRINPATTNANRPGTVHSGRIYPASGPRSWVASRGRINPATTNNHRPLRTTTGQLWAGRTVEAELFQVFEVFLLELRQRLADQITEGGQFVGAALQRTDVIVQRLCAQ